jgi:hypothetical protein
MQMDDDMKMEMMPMTFGKFSDYKLKLLFVSWDIQEKWQFALSWITVSLAVVVYHFIRFHIGELESHMAKSRLKAAPDSINYGTNLLSKRDDSSSNNSRTMLKMRLQHAFLSALNYGVSATKYSFFLYSSSIITYY